MKTTVKYLVICLWISSMAVTTLTTGCTHNKETRRSTGQYLDDQTITARVKSALFADPNVSGFQVNVDTYQGVVSLSGFVDTAAQKAKAEDVARQVSGVRQVQNNLSIRENIRRQ